ncbi:MAG: hypothetical protein RJA49_245, partial [Actinomycetota bacterium]
YKYASCTRTPGSAGVCNYTTSGTDRLLFNPWATTAVGTVVTVTWTMVDSGGNPGPDIVNSRTFVVTA